MHIGGGRTAVHGSRDASHPAARISLEDLPSEAVECIAQCASTPSTPAACLLPLVCSGWGTVVECVQLLVDIEVDLGPHITTDPAIDLDAVGCLQRGHGRATRTRPAAAAAAAAVPAALLRGRQLAAWLAKNRGSVRSLRIPGGWPYSGRYLGQYRKGWEEDLMRIRKALTARRRAPAAGPPLPHLVQLELPVAGLPGTASFLEALAGCPNLQQLTLKEAGCRQGCRTSCDQLGAAVAALRQLKALNLHFPRLVRVEGDGLAGLLRQLPPSLEQLQLKMFSCDALDSIPLSCITHLVNLRAWELFAVPLVVDDLSSSSSRSSSTSSSLGCGAAGLTALTQLCCTRQLQGVDARLHAPNLRYLYLSNGAEPAAWELLQSVKHLRQLTISIYDPEGDALDGLGGMTQLQRLLFYHNWPNTYGVPYAVHSMAAAVTGLTQLVTLSLPALVVVVGGPTLLTPLTQLKMLAVDFRHGLNQGTYPEGAEGFAATPGGAVVEVVAAALARGWQPLQQLGLDNLYGEVQKVVAAATAALPGVEVQGVR